MVVSGELKNTCAKFVTVELTDDGVVQKVEFIGGCQGNTQGISQLAKGMHVSDLIAKLRGINCGNKGTSCPDQLSKILEENTEF